MCRKSGVRDKVDDTTQKLEDALTDMVAWISRSNARLLLKVVAQHP
jgi:hypothetical protein